MIFHSINYAYLVLWIFVVLIYIMAVNHDTRVNYENAKLKKVHVGKLSFLYIHNKKNPKDVAKFTFILQSVSYVFIFISIALAITSSFFSLKIAEILFISYAAILFAFFVPIAIFCGIFNLKNHAVAVRAKDDIGYIEREKELFGRDELNKKQ